jgi:hypothetical protein
VKKADISRNKADKTRKQADINSNKADISLIEADKIRLKGFSEKNTLKCFVFQRSPLSYLTEISKWCEISKGF